MCQLQLGQRSRISPWVSRSARARTICSPVQNGVSPADGSWEGGSTWGSRSLERGGEQRRWGRASEETSSRLASIARDNNSAHARTLIHFLGATPHALCPTPAGQYYSAAPATRMHAAAAVPVACMPPGRADAVPGGGARAVQYMQARSWTEQRPQSQRMLGERKTMKERTWPADRLINRCVAALQSIISRLGSFMARVRHRSLFNLYTGFRTVHVGGSTYASIDAYITSRPSVLSGQSFNATLYRQVRHKI